MNVTRPGLWPAGTNVNCSLEVSIRSVDHRPSGTASEKLASICNPGMGQVDYGFNALPRAIAFMVSVRNMFRARLKVRKIAGLQQGGSGCKSSLSDGIGFVFVFLKHLEKRSGALHRAFEQMPGSERKEQCH
jgi:hypothetical protein